MVIITGLKIDANYCHLKYSSVPFNNMDTVTAENCNGGKL